MSRVLYALLVWGAALGLAHADGLRLLYPEGSIDSVEKADQALAAAQQARTRSDADFTSGQKACYKKILVNACINGVKEDRRQRMIQIDGVETEAKRYKRTNEGNQAAADRQGKIDQKAAGAEKDAAQRTQNRSEYDARQVNAANKAKERADQSKAGPGHAAAQAGRVQEANQKESNESATQRERAQQTTKAEADQKQKEQDAAERRERLAKKHEEKDAERSKKAAEQAAKNAKLPPAPPPQSDLPTPVPDLPLPR